MNRENIWKKIFEELEAFEGSAGFCYKNLVTGEEKAYNGDRRFLAASMVKLPLFMAMMLMRERGETDFDEMITIRPEQKIPGGAVRYMTGDVTMDIASLARLMIVISDSTATNALFRHYGAEKIGSCLRELGFSETQFNREYYSPLEFQGINNYFVPSEIVAAFERLYAGKVVSPQVSEEILEVLCQQQIDHKICGRLPEYVRVAHKTGEEDDKTHDAGIVFGSEPFIVCFAYVGAETADYNDFIRKTSEALWLAGESR
ncbi:MAG: serine hydrolase [Anaerovoracaceae bacterium]